ncbi:hypothetical protein MKW98_005470 [Papaver atlanticum]|uniref:F-box domain-containing protein n=1 Tax=Papaver atlanticum TaxID=357466 RepID=A0AAD4XQB9_9MAGN|nr:hypothetical protein MKW98_005470 [Papaver atlanticum]
MNHISNLPDDVLVRILSFVPAEQVLATSILSKRWTLLLTLNLDFIQFSERFDNLSLDVRKRRFLEFVEHLIFLREAEQLLNLRLAFNINEFKDYSMKLGLLVRSVMTSNCCALDLDFTCRNVWCIPFLYPDNHEVCTLPPCSFFPHQSVTHLTLTHCEFIPSLYKSLHSIKIVKLKSVRLGEGAVYDLVSKCPCLEELHLVTCEFRSSSFKLHVQESDLKCLVFQSCYGTKDMGFKSFSINIPSLLQLKYVGCMKDPFSIYDSDNLIEADIIICDLELSNQQKLLFFDLLKSLHNIKILRLYFQHLQVLSANSGSSLLTPFCNLKHLIVSIYPELVDEELLGLMCLLRNTPCLEKLSVDFHLYIKECKDKMISSVYNVDGGTSLEPHLLPSDCVSHLMKIDIKNFQGLNSEMGFVRFMLQKSPCLKDMVIFIRSRYEILINGMGKSILMLCRSKRTWLLRIYWLAHGYLQMLKYSQVGDFFMSAHIQMNVFLFVYVPECWKVFRVIITALF